MDYAVSGPRDVVRDAELITPCGGALVNLIAEGEETGELARRAAELVSLQLTRRTLCDLELLATGAFSPLDRFMGKADAERVAAEMRLAGGTLFPIPITLSTDQADGLAGQEIALRTSKNNLVGWMKVEEVYEWSHPAEAGQVFGTIGHPLVAEMRTWGRYRLSGPVARARTSQASWASLQAAERSPLWVRVFSTIPVATFCEMDRSSPPTTHRISAQLRWK